MGQIRLCKLIVIKNEMVLCIYMIITYMTDSDVQNRNQIDWAVHKQRIPYTVVVARLAVAVNVVAVAVLHSTYSVVAVEWE